MKSGIRHVVSSAMVAAGMLFAAQGANAVITGSAHDFSGKGYGSTEICIFCHAPHNTSTTNSTLWNRSDSTSVFVMYSNPAGTLNATGLAMGGVSKLCMSCHDGTIAVDTYLSKPTPGTHFVSGDPKVGPDLSNDHPIGFTYDAALATADGGLVTPTSASLVTTNVPLYGAKLECATCHDVHNKFSLAGLLRINNNSSALCLTCHTK